MATRELAPHEETKPGRVANPFTTQLDERLNAGAVAIESERAIAQVKAAITMAKACPRNKHAAMEKILDTCQRLEFAQTALYAYPRGGEKVEGPSIRLAEVLANAWGNMEFGIQELSQADGESEMLAYAWDLETNTRSSQSFRFKHERHTRQGITHLTDPRDIYETGANLGARRLRSRILAVIDQDLINAAVKQCRLTIAASVSGAGNKKTLTEKLDELVKQFGRLGIKVAHIEARLGHPIADTLPEEYTDLATIYVSLKDSMSQPADWFTVSKSTGASEKAQQIDSMLSGKQDDEIYQRVTEMLTQSGITSADGIQRFFTDNGIKKASVADLTNAEASTIENILREIQGAEGQGALV
jgi:hypothetical protein